MLVFKEVMQRQSLSGAFRAGAVGIAPGSDRQSAACVRAKSRLEGRSLLPVGAAQSVVSRGESENVLAGSAGLGFRLPDDGSQDFAIAFGCDWQPMLEIPGGEAAFGGDKPGRGTAGQEDRRGNGARFR